ncbi:MAG: OmpA family protein [Myxococcota bacterium]
MIALLAVVLAGTPSYELEGNALKVPAPIVFETGRATLAPESSAALDFVQGYLEAKSAISLLRVEVHTDDRGDAKANQALSEARAAAVVAALVKRGVDCKRLLAVGFGASKPVAGNDTAEGRAANRRTVFVNAALRGRAIGGLPVDGGGQPAATPCP